MPLKAEGDGISAFVVGFLPIGPVDLFAKGGLISWDTKVSGFDGDGTDLAYGVGAQFRVWSIGIRAEYEVFDVDDVEDLSMVSIGATLYSSSDWADAACAEIVAGAQRFCAPPRAFSAFGASRRTSQIND